MLDAELQGKYERFVELYNNPDEYTVHDIYHILDVTPKKYSRLRRQGLESGVLFDRCLSSKPGRKKKVKKNSVRNYFYDFKSRKWVVKKGKDYRMIYFGSYDSEEIAKQIVIELKKVNWDKSYLKSIQEKIIK